MRRSVVLFIIFLISGLWLRSAEAKIARGGGGMQPHVQNRSADTNRGNLNSGNRNAANDNRRSVNAANVNRGNVNAANINRGNVNAANVDRRNVNAANINRTNINAANVNRNVNVHSGYWDDPGWGWGSFATGAAVGATTAAAGAAIANSHPDTVVVAAPPVGSVVSTLPPSCSMAAGGPTLYSCDGVYYQPFYSGSNLVYQVVPAP